MPGDSPCPLLPTHPLKKKFSGLAWRWAINGLGMWWAAAKGSRGRSILVQSQRTIQGPPGFRYFSKVGTLRSAKWNFFFLQKLKNGVIHIKGQRSCWTVQLLSRDFKVTAAATLTNWRKAWGATPWVYFKNWIPDFQCSCTLNFFFHSWSLEILQWKSQCSPKRSFPQNGKL